MQPREWHAVGLTAGLLCALSLWARLPAPWRWPAAGAFLVVAALLFVIRMLVARRRRARPPRERESRPEPRKTPGQREAEPLRPAASRAARPRSSSADRRGSPVAHPYPARDALRLVERTGVELPANFRR